MCPTGVMASTTTEDFEKFYVTSYGEILGVVTLVTGSRASAEDLVHEALARAWERNNEIRDLPRWVLTVALNLGRNRWRRLRREVLRRDASEVATSPTAEVSLDLRGALRDLPTRQREVVVLHYFLDLSVADIAGWLELSEGGVKHALHRARRSLVNALSTEEVSDADPN